MIRKLEKEVLSKEIRFKDIQISNINDLMKIDKSFKDVVPILLKHIREIVDESDKQFLVRCLGVKGFTEATEDLITEFKNSRNLSYKWAIGNTLSIIQDKSKVEELLEIIQDKKHGIARQMLIIAVAKMKEKKGIPILLDLLNDEEVNGHVISGLAYYKDPKLIPYIEPLTNHPISWIRNEAIKIVGKFKR
ncbi:HEAT repeat domain-containing protein [Sutcliffiella horikoshii]|uniref:HEAT repeat domain-containing protein n=1 Tax=Sutcliffiella horikoshii TaxID=79883 RepID=UPI001F18CEC7|nr:hypothetical protein [Sutcliffiella horikoshii]MCG1021470.1 HEAT repeat domain-containing protein [Sutcliffiella horikoshii]